MEEVMKRRPLRSLSPKRRESLAERRRVRELVLARDGGCVAAGLVPSVKCAGPLDVDEIVPRGVRPGGELDPTNCQVLCRAHHRWKHANPIAAHDVGLREWSWEGNR